MSEARLRALERALADLRLRTPTPGLGNPGTSTAFGASFTRPLQVGFPAKLTSVYSSATGYNWAIRVLSNASAVIVDPTIPLTGTNAVEIGGRTDLAVGTLVWMELSPDGLGYVFVVGGGGAVDCAAIAGMATTDCLQLSVVAVSGACSGVDPDQLVPLVWDAVDLRWESSYDFTVTGSGAPGGPVVFWRADGRERLSIDGVELYARGCDEGGLVFVGAGAVLCGGVSEACADYFIVKVECHCCPATGFTGPGWYCVKASGVDCNTGNVVCVEYTTDIPCSGVTLCSGPHATQAACEAVCIGGGGGGSGGTAVCCGRDLAATLYASLSGGEGSMTLTWDAGNSRWAGSKALSCGETLYLRFSTCGVMTFSCNGTLFAPCARDFTPIACGPPYSDGVFTCNMDDAGAGCVAGSCGSITATVTE